MAFCYIRVEHYFFASLVHKAVRLIKLAPDLLVDGLWQPVWSMKDLQDEVMWFIVPIKSIFNLSHTLSSFFNSSCDITALTSDSEGVCQGDGGGSADSAGVVSSVRPSHKPQHQSVSLTGLLQRDPKNDLLKYCEFFASPTERQTNFYTTCYYHFRCIVLDEKVTKYFVTGHVWERECQSW